VTGTPSSFTPSGGAGTISIAVGRECAWSASSQAPWIAITSAAQGQGDGTVTYRVAENEDPVAREGTVAVSDRQVTVPQEAAGCRFQITRNGDPPAPGGGELILSIRTHAVCAWTAASEVPWATVTPGAGRGESTVRVTASPNTGEPRPISVVVAGERIDVVQGSSAVPPAPPAPPAPTPPTPTPPGPPAPTPPAPTPPAPPPPPPPAPPAPTPDPAPAPPAPPPPTPPPPPQPAPEKAIKVSGKVESLAGSCPALTFEVKNYRVYTSSATEFRRGGCRDVSKRSDVVVEGFQQADGRVRAVKITIDDD
jgi:hypothetical protein